MTDQLNQLLETRITTGGDVQEVIDMTTEQAVQQVLAQAAVDQLLIDDEATIQGAKHFGATMYSVNK